jgi:hypothetical protein
MFLGMRRHRTSTIAVWGLCSIVSLIFLLPELREISARTPRSPWMSFGVSVLPIRYQEVLGPLASSGRAIGLIAIASFVLGLITVMLLTRIPRILAAAKALSNALVSDRPASSIFLAGSGAFLVAYVVGTGYDYRLIFLSLTVGGILLAGRRAGTVALVTSGVLTILMLASGPWITLGELSDWAWLLAAPALAVFTAYVSWLLVMPVRSRSGSNT